MGSPSSQTVTQQPDKLTQQWRQLVMQYGLGALGLPGTGGQGAGGTPTSNLFNQFLGGTSAGGGGLTPMGGQLAPIPGVSPLTQQAVGGYQNALNLGNTALQALGGNANAFSQFQNPYQQAVLDQMQKQFGLLGQNATNQINDQATQAHAFGGTRQGVAQGVALGQIANSAAQQMAGLTSQGYDQARQAALQAAGLGMGAAGQLGNLGEYERQVSIQQDPVLRQLQILQGLMTGMPFGQTTSQPVSTNPLGGALGGAAAGSAFGPWGAGAGALLGLFGSL